MSDLTGFIGSAASDESEPQPKAGGRIHKVTKLDIRFEVPGVDSKRIYANGRMQARVWVLVEAQDEDGNPVKLPYFPDLMSARLIQYHNGKPLETNVYLGKPLAGWNSSTTENRYSHAMPGGLPFGPVSEPLSAAQNEPLVFWVSASEVAQAQIAVEVTLQGKVYRSNNTTNPDGRKINKSIIIQAEKKVTYGVEQFRWSLEETKVGSATDTLFLYHLGLYPGATQIKLLSWESAKYNELNRYPIDFYRAVPRSAAWAIKYLAGVFPSSAHNSIRVNMPGGQYDIKVHHRSGELSLVKGVANRSAGFIGERRDLFPFTVIDEYGNDHNLSISVDEHNLKFALQRG
ncbi:MAG: hypothetical protein ACRESJ_16555 [Pseudomonas sp.]|uniref:hypothetical protein n=1 Tax=Pseudomonas sp. TaxID=306 RepID=UPI003D6EB242